MHDLITFHPTAHGVSVRLSDGNSLATRSPAAATNAIVFSSGPLVVNQKVRLELTTGDEWPVVGHVRVGLTTTDPGTLNQLDIPEFAYPELVERKNFWVRTVDKWVADRTPRFVTLCLTSDGSLMFGPERDARTTLFKAVPTDQGVWLLLDIYGRTTGVRVVQPDDVPPEIVALGPVSVQSYEAACEAGYQSAYRTRLVLFGQDIIDKNCLRSKMLSFRTGGAFGLSASAIDLSASCSFSLNNQSKWKLATSTEEIFPLGQVNATDCDPRIDEDKETRSVAMATNAVLRVLQLRNSIRSRPRVRLKSSDNGVNLSSTKTDLTEEDHPLLIDAEDDPRTTTDRSDPLRDLPADSALIAKEMLDDIERRRREDLPSPKNYNGVLQRLNSSFSQHERDVHFNVLDCSGDEVYFASNQVFMSGRSVFLFVVDLSLDLNERRQTSSEIDAEVNDACDSASISCLDYLDFWLRSIRVHASLASCRDSRPGAVDQPPVFIIGSNRDALHSDPKEQLRLVEKKFEQIRDRIEGQPYEGQVVDHFYVLSRDCDSDEEIEQIDALRGHVEAVARSLPHMGEFIPQGWLNFEQTVDRLVSAGTNFCSVRQLQEVSLEEGVRTESEFDVMVQFYHELGLIMRVGTSSSSSSSAASDVSDHRRLSNSVILKPLWLVDICKSIFAAENSSHVIKKPADDAVLYQFKANGILTEHLLDLLLGKSFDQKPIVISCMENLDLIIERPQTDKVGVTNSFDRKWGKCFVVPYRFGFSCLPDKPLHQPRRQDVVFYYDFRGFLPDALFYKILVRAYRWSVGFGGSEPRLARGKGRFYLDSEHDFAIILLEKHLARIKVVVLRVLVLDGIESDGSVEEDVTVVPPKPHVAAKVRYFLELTLCELREKWMKHLSYGAYVKCWCDKPCSTHLQVRCADEDCVHLLSLDECLSNKVVYCDHRRCKTTALRKSFPTSRLTANRAPADQNMNIEGSGNTRPPELPTWVRSAAKLLNGGAEGFDWVALAHKFGYKRNKIDTFNYDPNPGLALITDWIISSGNTTLSVDMMVKFLEQMRRNDVIEVIQKGQEVEVSPPQVFISYQWEIQDEVTALRDVLERSGLSCWLDIGQMGGGDYLYAKVYDGIKNSKVTIACLTNKYLVSHYCNREMALADLLHKPIIPVLFEAISWPPVGPMALVFSTLVYVNLKGVGGHGGSGVHADLDAKYQEIVTRVSNHATPQKKPLLSLSTRSSSEDQSLDEPIAPNSGPGQQRSSGFYPSSNHPQSELQSSRPMASLNARTSRSQGPEGGGRVQPVHVAKCVVCSIL